MCVAGIDPGSFNTVSYIAWLEDKTFWLDLYQASYEQILPSKPDRFSQLSHIAIDAPLGLPQKGSNPVIRKWDREAACPTKRLPMNRSELVTWKIYKGLIEFGIEVAWQCYMSKDYLVYGFEKAQENRTLVCETYPRRILQRRVPEARIPSKRKNPVEYADFVVNLLKLRGYDMGNVLRPTTDQCDAMLCAISAETLLKQSNKRPSGTVGLPPQIDIENRIIREGFIVSP